MQSAPTPATLLKIATANQQLVQTVQELYHASQRSPASDAPRQVNAYVGPTLDLTGNISAALNPPDSNLLMIASANQRIISQTQTLYDRLRASDPEFAGRAEPYISRVLDLTEQISAAIPGS